jgi:thioredoxin 1
LILPHDIGHLQLINQENFNMAGTIGHVDASTFQPEVISSGIPVLVDFWAEWCGPCKAIAPVLEQLNGELAGKLKIVKVNVDEAPDLAQQFQIRSIPTLLVFKGGRVVDQKMGAMSKAQFSAWLQPHLG